MKIEFINFNDDSLLDPEIKSISLSGDSAKMPPSFCLPWVEASRYCIQLKSNQEYWVRKGEKAVEACVVIDGKPQPSASVFAQIPDDIPFIPRNEIEAREKKLRLSQAPSFSSPWQSSRVHSVTLKVGICWWTPPGWALFFTSAIHRNEGFRIVEGLVRTDLWHRDIPILVQPLQEEIRIPKYSVLASIIPVSTEEIELVEAERNGKKMKQLADQTSLKRAQPGIYKKMVLPKK